MPRQHNRALLIGKRLWPSSKILAAARDCGKERRGDKSGKVRTPIETGAALPVSGSSGSLPNLPPYLIEVSQKKRRTSPPLCFCFSAMFSPCCSTHCPTPRVPHPWPHAACHVPPTRRPSSLAPLDATGYLNRHTVTSTYISYYVPRIHHPLPTQTSSETDAVCKQPFQLAIFATHGLPDPSVDKSIAQTSRRH